MSRYATYTGEIVDQNDALILMNAVLEKRLPGVNKKLPEHEKLLIQPGDCFVFIESQSEIQRW